MVYPSTHLLCTLTWKNMQSGVEYGQTGFRVNQSSMPDETAREATQNAWGLSWVAPVLDLSSSFHLIEFKWALIGPDGRYPDGEDSIIAPYTPTLAGGDATPNKYPLQIACAVSLTTDAARGRASMGRMYFPPPSADMTSGGGVVWGDQTTRANQIKSAINATNGFLAGQVSVFSKVGTGASRPVTGVRIGNRPDVQRRRARQLPETYYAVTL